jgi:hypothetical protein
MKRVCIIIAIIAIVGLSVPAIIFFAGKYRLLSYTNWREYYNRSIVLSEPIMDTVILSEDSIQCYLSKTEIVWPGFHMYKGFNILSTQNKSGKTVTVRYADDGYLLTERGSIICRIPDRFQRAWYRYLHREYIKRAKMFIPDIYDMDSSTP